MYSVLAEFSTSDQIINLCRLTSKGHARNWAKSWSPTRGEALVRIFIRNDMSGQTETIWDRDWGKPQ
jgi:hypothetical protein